MCWCLHLHNTRTTTTTPTSSNRRRKTKAITAAVIDGRWLLGIFESVGSVLLVCVCVGILPSSAAVVTDLSVIAAVSDGSGTDICAVSTRLDDGAVFTEVAGDCMNTEVRVGFMSSVVGSGGVVSSKRGSEVVLIISDAVGSGDVWLI